MKRLYQTLSGHHIASWSNRRKTTCFCFSFLALFITSGLHSLAQTCYPFIFTVAGSSTTVGYSGDGGPATAALMGHPYDMAMDAASNIYISDGNSARIRKVNTSGIITTFAGGGGDLSNGVPATTADLSPYSVAVDNSGNLYVWSYGWIRKINSAGIINDFYHNSLVTTGMVADNSGNLYITDANQLIKKINSAGVMTYVTGSGYGFTGDGGPASAASLNFPQQMALDAAGNLYVSDRSNNRIRKINTSGIISTFAGNGTSGISGDGGPATAAAIGTTAGITADAAGNICFVDDLHNVVRKVDASGIITTIAGNGVNPGGIAVTPFGQGDGGPATNAEFSSPRSIASDASGILYVLDYYEPSVRKVMPSVGVIAGLSMACVGGVATLTDPTGTGTWSSSNPAIGTIGPASGVFTAIATGTTTITYNNSSCPVANYSTTVSVVSSVASITGTGVACVSDLTTLSDPGGGTWTSATPTIATVGSLSGIVTGVSVGTDVITYTLTAGCYNTKTVTINPGISPVTGPTGLCTGTTILLSDATTGGSWTSSNAILATVIGSGTSAGTVTGVASGTLTITYTVGACYAAYPVTVSPTMYAIAGAPSTCIGSTAPLFDLTTGGTWSSSAPAIASIGSATGIYTGLTLGVATMTYTLGTGCIATTPVTVNPALTAITGTPAVCIGGSYTLSDPTGGGTWTSADVSKATITGATGILTGVSAGLVTITYTLPSGCYTTVTATVVALPSPLTGSSTVCPGASTTWSVAPLGGIWTSGSPGIATVGSSSGIVTGVSTGVATITYTLSPSTCFVTRPITVSAAPAPITGPTLVCVGTSVTLSDATPGGSWSSTNISVGYYGSTGALVISGPGTTIITYAIISGCSTSVTLTANPAPSAISGPSLVCFGSSITLTDVGGGVWSSATPSVAAIGSATGVVTGGSVGTSTISYTLPTSCSATTVVTVSTLPSTISGPLSYCVGVPGTLTDAGGGTWSSSAPTTATIGSSSGIVLGIAAGTATITYSLGTGCNTSVTISVNPSAAAITGVFSLCAGSTTTLADATGGGTWSSGTPAVATIGSSSGIVTALVPGVTTIVYTLGSGCTAAAAITVNPLPATITGIFSLCVGDATTLFDASGTGTWSSSSTAVATIGSSSGNLSAVSGGVSTIHYTLSTGCTTSAVVTVNALPGSITGTPSVCVGATTMLSSTGGGSWSSSSPTTAVIGSASGTVTGNTSGTATISYTLPTGCYVTTVVTVNPLPGAISGTPVVCEGDVTNLYGSGGGTWSSASTTNATIGSATGLVNGILTGTSVINYTLGTGCFSSVIVTVNAAPSSISGITSVCAGSATTLTDAGGGTWTSASTSVATIGSSSGIVSGLLPGSSVIDYTLGTGCSTSITITISATPGAISGAATVCVGSTTTLSDAGGGMWNSSSVGVATIGSSSGLVAGITPGTSTITYSLGTGCTTSIIVTVNPSPGAISGPGSVCVGYVITLSDAGGGTWTSGSANASIGSSSGIVTGVSSGTSVITYTLPAGCTETTVITVNPLPSAISGSPIVCVGYAATLSDAGGGTWSSGSTGIATIGSSTGIISGVSGGNANITYTVGTGCSTSVIATVNPLPASISGTPTLCQGASTTLSDATGGGSWSSSAPTIAAAGSSSGIVTGMVAGTATINYTLGTTGCSSSVVVTVNPLPASISGTPTVCAGSTTTLTDAGGGTWSSGSTSIATIGSSSGIASGLSAGTALINYALGTGCSTSIIITVNPAPSAISGTLSVCAGSATTLTDAGGGTWTSGSTGVATIGSSSGIASGVTSGSSAITYTLSTGCHTTTAVTVDPLPSSITGVATLYLNTTITLADGTGGGSWSSSSSNATVGSSTGVVTGISGGSATISYTLGTGCYTTASVSVTGTPAPIAGSSSVCEGNTTTLTDASSAGTWTSSDITVASVGSASGIVTGIAGGTVTITYAVSGANATFAMTVTPIPAAITGGTSVCSGSALVLADAATGGTWTSSSTSIATVVSTSGLVSGVATGTVTISYSTGCGTDATYTVSVNPTPDAGTVSGSSVVYSGASITLTESVTGGLWSSSNTGVAVIGSSSGVVTGVSAGSATISYTVTACSISASATFAITDSPVNRISGNINFTSGAISTSGTIKVWLITYDTSALLLTAVDSLTFTSSGTSVYYEFLGEPVDSYRVKAAYYPATFTGTGYIPTYHTSHFYWHDADVRYHTTGSDDGTDITMGYGTTSGGPGFISGYVTSGANKGTTGAIPVAGLLVFIKDATGAILEQAYTDTGGNYTFTNLAVDQTYDIYPEAINYATTPYTSISLTSGSDSVSNVDFVQHTISGTITPVGVGIKNVHAVVGSSIAVFPNPTDGIINLQWNETTTEKGEVTLFDAVGRKVYANPINLTQGAGTSQVDLSGFTNGTYLITIKSTNISYTSKIQLQLQR